MSSHQPIILPVLCGILLWVFLYFPIFLLLILPTHLLRWGTHLCARLFRPDLIAITGIMDSYFSLSPLRTHSNNKVGLMLVAKGNIDMQKEIQRFYNLFLSTPQLRKQYRNLYCYLEKWGPYVFKKALPPDELILEKYITKYDGPPFKNEEDLDSFIGVWFNQRKDDKKIEAHWKLLFIYLEDKDESVVLIKGDHGLSDGYTIIGIFGILAGNKETYDIKGPKVGLMRRFGIMLASPYHLLLRTCRVPSMERIPFPKYTSLQNGSDNDWGVAFTTLDLETVKNIRKQSGARIISILATIQNGALRRYCLEHGKKETDLPEVTLINIPVPLPNHPALSDGAVGEKMKNHHAGCFIEVPFREESPLIRLRKTEDDIQFATNVWLPMAMRWLVMSTLWGFPAKLVLKFVEWNPITKFGFINPCSQGVNPLLISNKPQTIFGLDIKHIRTVAQLPISAPSVEITLQSVSHGGQMDLTVNTNFKIFKDQKEIDQFTKTYFKDELMKLAECVNNDK